MFELAFIVGINIYLEGGRNKIHKIHAKVCLNLNYLSWYVPRTSIYSVESVSGCCWKRSGQEKAEKKQRRFRDGTLPTYSTNKLW
jgi:hypothetical protein